MSLMLILLLTHLKKNTSPAIESLAWLPLDFFPTPAEATLRSE